MKWLFVIVLCSCMAATKAASPIVSVHFSPNGGCTEAVVGLIGQARVRIRMLAYSFTSTAIARALIAAKERGIDVAIVIDKSDVTERGEVVSLLTSHGVSVFVDSRHKIMHEKVLIVDGEYIETGSFNYTEAAEKGNAENALILRDGDLARAYEANWQEHRSHSE